MMRTIAVIAMVLSCAALFAGTEVTAGGYAPFVESKTTDPTAPGYYFLTGRALYEPFENLFLGGDLLFLHGFPDGKTRNFVETSYLLGRGRLFLQYDFPRVKLGTVTYASISDASEEYAKSITQGKATLGGYRRDAVHEELYLKAEPVDGLFLAAAAGVASRSFDVLPELGSGVIRDTDLFTYGEVSYRIFPALEPFAAAFYGDDLNAQDTFDLLRLRGGLRGEELFLEKQLHLAYAVYYKREESGPLQEKNRLALHLKGRWNFPTGTDLFAWFYHEYAFSGGPVRYVDRHLAAQVRQWAFERRLAFSAGSFLLIEKRRTGHWFLPLWPFVEVQAYPVTGLDLRARVHLKFDEILKPSGKREYGLFQTRFEAGGGYLIGGYVEPALLFFMNLAEGPGSPDSLGLKLFVTAFF